MKVKAIFPWGFVEIEFKDIDEFMEFFEKYKEPFIMLDQLICYGWRKWKK